MNEIQFYDGDEAFLEMAIQSVPEWHRIYAKIVHGRDYVNSSRKILPGFDNRGRRKSLVRKFYSDLERLYRGEDRVSK